MYMMDQRGTRRPRTDLIQGFVETNSFGQASEFFRPVLAVLDSLFRKPTRPVRLQEIDGVATIFPMSIYLCHADRGGGVYDPASNEKVDVIRKNPFP